MLYNAPGRAYNIFIHSGSINHPQYYNSLIKFSKSTLYSHTFYFVLGIPYTRRINKAEWDTL